MIVCSIRVHDGDVSIELVESGDNFTGVRVVNTASVTARVKVWLAGGLLFNRTIEAGGTYSRNVTARAIAQYMEQQFDAAFTASVA